MFVGGKGVSSHTLIIFFHVETYIMLLLSNSTDTIPKGSIYLD